MATSNQLSRITLIVIFSILAVFGSSGNAQLSPYFYAKKCPQLSLIVRKTMEQAVRRQPRTGASVLRLFFHDCFVNGCDASVLLDDRPNFKGEKNAFPNVNSLRGFEVIDAIKAKVEDACKGTVSCADVLALAARDGVSLLGGPWWRVPLGRRDATTASQSAANTNLPPPFADLQTLIAMFAAKGLSARDMTALSGSHTIGLARCETFRPRIYSPSDIAPPFAAARRATCPATPGNGDDNLAPIDLRSPFRFDNGYYKNLMERRGLFKSDQELFSGGSQDWLVRLYSRKPWVFARDFATSMVKMGNIDPLTKNQGEIRRSCRVIN